MALFAAGAGSMILAEGLAATLYHWLKRRFENWARQKYSHPQHNPPPQHQQGGKQQQRNNGADYHPNQQPNNSGGQPHHASQ
jgi:hypothetical protein